MVIRNTASAYARRINTIAPFAYETGARSTRTWSNLPMIRERQRGVSDSGPRNSILANMHVASLGNDFTRDNVVLFYLDVNYGLQIVSPAGAIIDFVDFSDEPQDAETERAWVPRVYATIDQELTRPIGVDAAPVINQERITLKRVALRYVGQAITYDVDNNIRGQVRPERTIYCEVQGDLPDTVLNHDGLLIFRYRNQLYLSLIHI